MQSNKSISDIEDCIRDLQRCFSAEDTLIDHKLAALLRFEEKLDLVLQYGLKEKPGLLGLRKSFWDYVCTCFSVSKRAHDGIQHVKAMPELKTSLGKGRAFVRFCVMQRCLADTLQSCFIDHKITREFYYNKSIPAQTKLWSPLIKSLYDLNELNFDIIPQNSEFDLPSFARKPFLSSEDHIMPNRKLSSSSLSSELPRESSVNDFKKDQDRSSETCDATSQVEIEMKRLSKLNDELVEQNQSLKREMHILSRENSKLEDDVQNLKLKCQFLQNELSAAVNEGYEHISEVQFVKQTIPEAVEEDVCTVFHSDSPSSTNCCTLDELERPHFYDKKSVCELVSHSCLEGKITSLQDQNSETEQKSAICCYSSCRCLEHIDHRSFQMHKENNFVSSVVPKAGDAESDLGVSSLLPTERSDVDSETLLKYKIDSFDTFKNEKDTCQSADSKVNSLLMEMKAFVDTLINLLETCDKTTTVSHLSHLKTKRDSLETQFSTAFQRFKEYEDKNIFIEKYTHCITNLAMKQDNIINSLQERVSSAMKGNTNLYSTICALKDLLHSYGFLRIIDAKSAKFQNQSLSFSVPPSHHPESVVNSIICDNVDFDFASNDSEVSVLQIFKTTLSKLTDLSTQVMELQLGLDSTQELNNNLICRVKDQEVHLKGITKELEEAQHLVSMMKEQHQKLQSSEGFLKYDLQEKRKLLTRLKHQLETTREDWNRVRLKNSESEAEWQSLRKEFVERHKQSSEESGFVDDRGTDEHNNDVSNSVPECSISDTQCSQNNSDDESKVSGTEPVKKSRLEILEEECQRLYSSLLQGSKRRQDIDSRLESMCKAVSKLSTDETDRNESLSDILPDASQSEEILIDNTSEENCNDYASNDHSSSEIGSLNSDCSSCVPVTNTAAVSTEACSSFDFSAGTICSPFIPSDLSVVSECQSKESYESDIPVCVPESSSLGPHDSGYEDLIEPSQLLEIVNENSEIKCTTLSQVDSLLIKKKDLEESLKCMELQKETFSGGNREDLTACIETLRDEKKILQNKVQELEKKTLIISTELDQTTHQLILSKAAKEHEVAALQFQLNTEALKYERALKLQELHVALAAQEEECFSLSEDLEKCLTFVEDERKKNDILLSQFEEFKAYSRRDKSVLEAEFINLQNDSRQLRKRLIKLLKEKDVLWKRIDHLSHLQKIKIDDRWMDDREATNCLGCNNHFSFLLRKHHCRLCGRIFCHSCSNNWLLTPSSRKQIRTCNECFVQHAEMKKDLNNSSEVLCIGEGSEDEAVDDVDVSVNPNISSTFNSGIPSDIANSNISLPVKEIATFKRSTCISRFASAPDLLSVFKYEENLLNMYLLPKPVNISANSSERSMNLKAKEIPYVRLERKDSTVSTEKPNNICCEKNENGQNNELLYEENLLNDTILVEDIIASEYGIKGKLLIGACEKSVIPILCERCPIELQWSISSDSGVVFISLVHEVENSDATPTVLFSSENETKSRMQLSLPGLYSFYLDNTSRMNSVMIHYTFIAKYADTCD
ncbi:FYVE and coiled-coil domain-containing protein 1-like isoform X2 [Stegodyphus dumicola]|uniref:FYVE and coiled-coil domain-containing protein 1-like isoform X2 n=1 Tax=Stegodyphus dumicola TaxID=202533 RepID=UPI0015AC8E6C|nr:FYVE and coiled-coil domain-containing protein 1-like isoform X2 [Stegodyphus dumicola]